MDFLLDAQGEDIVAGRHTVDGAEELMLLAPELHEQIAAVCPLLEAEFEDAQEFELTVEDGELFLLQTRTAKRTPWAALRITVDQVQEGLINQAAALERINPLDLDGIGACTCAARTKAKRCAGPCPPASASRAARSRSTPTRPPASPPRDTPRCSFGPT